MENFKVKLEVEDALKNCSYSHRVNIFSSKGKILDFSRFQFQKNLKLIHANGRVAIGIQAHPRILFSWLSSTKNVGGSVLKQKKQQRSQ